MTPKIATVVSSIMAFVLAILKLSIGTMSGSVAVIASAVDSLLDMAVSIFNVIAVRVSESNITEQYNYGKGKIEGLAALLEGLLISASAIFIMSEAVQKILHKDSIVKLDASIYVMLFSIVATFFLVIFLNAVAKKSDSLVIKSDAVHYKTDLISNLAIIITLIAVKLTGFYYIDFAVSIFIGIYILYSAWELIKDGFGNILDVSLDFNTVEMIKEIIKKEPLVLDYHCLRTRKAGHRNFIDVHLVLTPDMKLKMAHMIIDNVESKIRNIDKEKVWVINIHADPYDDSQLNKMNEDC